VPMAYKLAFHEAHPQEREMGDHIHIYFQGSAEEVKQSKRELEAKMGKNLEGISSWVYDHGRNYEIPCETVKDIPFMQGILSPAEIMNWERINKSRSCE